MKNKELSSQNIGKNVIYKDDVYVKETNKFIDGFNGGKIISLLIDINFGAYGFKVLNTDNKEVNFIYKRETTKNLIGRDLQDLQIFI